MKIYECTDYRLFLRNKIAEIKRSDAGFTNGHLAKLAGVKGAYFSQVLGGSQDFNQDQIYAVGLGLSLFEEELSYLLLLNEWSRCSVDSRKKKIFQEIERIQDSHLRVVEYLAFDHIDFQHSPIDDVLCDSLSTTLESYFVAGQHLNNPEKLRRKLGVSAERFKSATNKLVAAEIITPKNEAFERKAGEIFVYKINTAAKYNAVYSRLKAIDKAFESDPSDLISTLIFTANEDFIQKVKAEILAFQSEAVARYGQSEPDEVVFINIDLFAVE